MFEKTYPTRIDRQRHADSLLRLGNFAMPLLVATVSLLLAAIGAKSDDPAPSEVLIVPIQGTIGADVTVDGLSTTLKLTDQRPIETILVEIDAQTGDLEVGSKLAQLIAGVPDRIRVIGLLKRVGGASLPVAWACDEWLVQDTISIRVPDPRGGMTDRLLGPDRVVIQTLPRLTSSETELNAELSQLRAACQAVAASDRSSLLKALTVPGASIELRSDASEASLVAKQGPGLRGDQLVTLGLARMNDGDVATALEDLGVQEDASLGDTGALLIDAAADERLAQRGRLGNRIDSLFSSLDGVASLTAGASWSLARARLSDPESSRLASQFPMRWTPQGWTIDDAALPAWKSACRDSIRRWSGVVELLETVDTLLVRADTILAEITAMTPTPLDAARRAAAMTTATEAIETYRRTIETFEGVPMEAEREIRRVEALLEQPPILPNRE